MYQSIPIGFFNTITKLVTFTDQKPLTLNPQK